MSRSRWLRLRRTSFALRRKVSEDDRMSWNERPSWFMCRPELRSGGLRFVLRFLRRRPQRIPRTEGRSELELIAGAVNVVLERVCVRRHHRDLLGPPAQSRRAVERAVRRPRFFPSDRGRACASSPAGARRALAVRTLIG